MNKSLKRLVLGHQPTAKFWPSWLVWFGYVARFFGYRGRYVSISDSIYFVTKKKYDSHLWAAAADLTARLLLEGGQRSGESILRSVAACRLVNKADLKDTYKAACKRMGRTSAINDLVAQIRREYKP